MRSIRNDRKTTSHATPNLIIVGIINAAITGIVYYFPFPQRNLREESQAFNPAK